jgi:hypothetical protein
MSRRYLEFGMPAWRGAPWPESHCVWLRPRRSWRATVQIPSAALYAIFWSCIMVIIMALLAGVMIGYRRS